MAEATSYLTRWLVGPGDNVQEGADLAEVETDKAVITIASPATGVVGDRLFPDESEIPFGSPITWIEVSPS
jgi:pyruvate/2-oxoglutarate dehydrogenase complex dihydrolipoamide acyltransferase (E2) component